MISEHQLNIALAGKQKPLRGVNRTRDFVYGTYPTQAAPRMIGRRGMTGLIVGLLHLGFGYVLYRGLMAPPAPIVVPPIIIQQIDKPPAREKLTTPSPKVEQVQPYVPIPEYVDVNAPVETNAITVQSVTAVTAPEPTVVQTPISRTGASVDPRNPLHIGEEYYPDASKRASEEGACRVQLRVKADGFIGDATIVASSGFPRLDDACLKGVAGQKMLPATENGKPVESVTVIRIRWALRKGRY